jgi:excisionase family DNA binding protein
VEVITRILYDRKGAAQQLSISVRSLDYLIAQGKIPTRRLNSSVRIRHEDLKEFARGNHQYDTPGRVAEHSRPSKA